VPDELISTYKTRFCIMSESETTSRWNGRWSRKARRAGIKSLSLSLCDFLALKGLLFLNFKDINLA